MFFVQPDFRFNIRQTQPPTSYFLPPTSKNVPKARLRFRDDKAIFTAVPPLLPLIIGLLVGLMLSPAP